MTPIEILHKEYGSIINKKIVGIRPLVKEELDELYWTESYGEIAFAIILEDDQVLVPSRDPECNGPGFIILASMFTDEESII